MGEGAPDYTHLRQILARDADGNLVPVACDPSGRIILLPYGMQTVAQDDPIRTIQGADGATLHTIAVDASGRMIMIPYGTTSVDGTVNVDQNDLDRTMQGLDGATLRTIMVDAAGRMVMVPYGFDGANYRILKVDDEGRMIGVLKGQADVKWGLVGWWKFVGSEGTTIKDYSGYGNNGSAFSGVAVEAHYVPGVIGEALEFDGDDDYVTAPDDDSLDITGAFTIECWIKRIASSGDFNEHIVRKDKNYIMRMTPGGRLHCYYWSVDGNRYYYLSDYDVPLGTWIHIILTVPLDPLEAVIYINAEPISIGVTVMIQGAVYTNNLLLGGVAAGNEQLEGYLDEVRIYARALSADEVAWRYEHTNPTNPKPTRMIAVDSEGRMEVNLKDLPYKDQVLERFQQICSPAGNYNLQSSVVPQGKLWVINVCNAYVDTAAIDTIDIGIYNGSDNFIVAYEYGTGLVGWVNIQTPLILKAGDRINAGYVGVGNNGLINLVVNGYELDVP